MTNCEQLRRLLESENPHIYIFDKQGQRLIATLRVVWRYSKDSDGTPRIGFPIDVVFYDVNTCWQQRARQYRNVTILRLRTLYAHELLQLAEWLKRYAELVTKYVTECLDGEQAAQAQAVPTPPVPQAPTQPAPPKPAGEEAEDIEDIRL